jgi:hypothetical protein
MPQWAVDGQRFQGPQLLLRQVSKCLLPVICRLLLLLLLLCQVKPPPGNLDGAGPHIIRCQ